MMLMNISYTSFLLSLCLTQLQWRSSYSFIVQNPSRTTILHEQQQQRRYTTHIALRNSASDVESNNEEDESSLSSSKHAAVAAATVTVTTTTTTTATESTSFEDAQVIGKNLATMLTESCSNGEPIPLEARELLQKLVSTTSGARGWFVSLLTTPEFEPLFQTTTTTTQEDGTTRIPMEDSILSAICNNPDPNIKLMTMNIAMPTAMELTHTNMGNEELANASKMTARRACILVEELLLDDRLPGLRDSLEALLLAVTPTVDNSSSDVDADVDVDVDTDDMKTNGGDCDDEWLNFCDRWGYGIEQKEAIRIRIESILNATKN